MPRAGGGGGEFVFGGDRVSVYEEGKSSGRGGTDGRTTVRVCLMPLNWTPRNG